MVVQRVLVLGAVCWGVVSGIADAAGPGVPSVQATAADYFGYAADPDTLPAYYRQGPVAAANNTPTGADANPITNAGAELGRVLFYDGRLSHNDGASCASCHVQENGFGDPNQFSEGFEGGLTGRHSPGLTNAAFYARGRFFWDERAETLEEQVLMPIQDQVEMGISNLEDLEDKLQATEFYPTLFERAFGDSEVTSDRIAKSMAQFVRSMVSYQSKFDTAIQAGSVQNPDFEAAGFTQQEQDGHALFAANCNRCHGGAAHIANAPENIGLDATNIDDPGTDLAETGVEAGFKVASLRNIAVRGRFMHDGRFASLEEVIEFYSSGVQNNPELSRGIPVGGFGFSAADQAALVAFLETLTDEAFLSSELFSDPFVQLDGDYNGDGVVDTDDYLVWKNDFNTLADEFAPLMADGNNDGIVDAADFAIWRDNLGARWDDGTGFAAASVAAGAAAAAVPEPATMILLAFGALALRWRRRGG